jgi:hypothetical protein
MTKKERNGLFKKEKLMCRKKVAKSQAFQMSFWFHIKYQKSEFQFS